MTVTVALPCYNAEAHLSDALDALLKQTFRSLEIIAVDDGSTDGTARILESYANRDRRMRIVRHESNLGLIPTLNRAVAEATGEYLARIDADDVCHPARIERQVAFLEQHPEIGVVGCAIRPVSPERRWTRPRPVRCRTPEGARFMSFLGNPVTHTTLLARTQLMREHPYGVLQESLHTEDYELFSRMIRHGIQFANLLEPLVTVRLDPGGVSLSHETVQVDNFVWCARRHLKLMLGWDPPEVCHRVMVNRLPADLGSQDLEDGLSLLNRLEAEAISLGSVRAASDEIAGICDMQRVDVLLQALLKGSGPLRRSAGVEMARSARRLSSKTSRWYIGTKLPRR